MSAQPTLVTRYRDTGGTVHELHVHRTADGAWEVLDRTATATNVVDTLMGYDDDRSAAEAVARDYAEQHARSAGRRLDRGGFAPQPRARPRPPDPVPPRQ